MSARSARRTRPLPAAACAEDFERLHAANQVSGDDLAKLNDRVPLTPASAGSVITSLDLEPASGLFALSWVQSTPTSNVSALAADQSTQASAFVAIQNSVAPANLQATATSEGTAGR